MRVLFESRDRIQQVYTAAFRILTHGLQGVGASDMSISDTSAEIQRRH
jgi:hypothetical protein